VCGLANASDAVQVLGLSLVLPAAEDDLQLTAAGKSALSSCIFLGEPASHCSAMCLFGPCMADLEKLALSVQSAHVLVLSSSRTCQP
jgi:hypothetical protein